LNYDTMVLRSTPQIRPVATLRDLEGVEIGSGFLV
jgi:hypothetical protein